MHVAAAPPLPATVAPAVAAAAPAALGTLLTPPQSLHQDCSVSLRSIHVIETCGSEGVVAGSRNASHWSAAPESFSPLRVTPPIFAALFGVDVSMISRCVWLGLTTAGDCRVLAGVATAGPPQRQRLQPPPKSPLADAPSLRGELLGVLRTPRHWRLSSTPPSPAGASVTALGADTAQAVALGEFTDSVLIVRASRFRVSLTQLTVDVLGAGRALGGIARAQRRSFALASPSNAVVRAVWPLRQPHNALFVLRDDGGGATCTLVEPPSSDAGHVFDANTHDSCVQTVCGYRGIRAACPVGGDAVLSVANDCTLCALPPAAAPAVGLDAAPVMTRNVHTAHSMNIAHCLLQVDIVQRAIAALQVEEAVVDERIAELSRAARVLSMDWSLSAPRLRVDDTHSPAAWLAVHAASVVSVAIDLCMTTERPNVAAGVVGGMAHALSMGAEIAQIARDAVDSEAWFVSVTISPACNDDDGDARSDASQRKPLLTHTGCRDVWTTSLPLSALHMRSSSQQQQQQFQQGSSTAAKSTDDHRVMWTLELPLQCGIVGLERQPLAVDVSLHFRASHGASEQASQGDGGKHIGRVAITLLDALRAPRAPATPAEATMSTPAATSLSSWLDGGGESGANNRNAAVGVPLRALCEERSDSELGHLLLHGVPVLSAAPLDGVGGGRDGTHAAMAIASPGFITEQSVSSIYQMTLFLAHARWGSAKQVWSTLFPAIATTTTTASTAASSAAAAAAAQGSVAGGVSGNGVGGGLVAIGDGGAVERAPLPVGLADAVPLRLPSGDRVALSVIDSRVGTLTGALVRVFASGRCVLALRQAQLWRLAALCAQRVANAPPPPAAAAGVNAPRPPLQRRVAMSALSDVLQIIASVFEVSKQKLEELNDDRRALECATPSPPVTDADFIALSSNSLLDMSHSAYRVLVSLCYCYDILRDQVEMNICF